MNSLPRAMTLLDPWLPLLLYRITIEHRKKRVDEIISNVEPYQNMINPKCCISSGRKNPKILE